jgi:hypothetical protein
MEYPGKSFDLPSDTAARLRNLFVLQRAPPRGKKARARVVAKKMYQGADPAARVHEDRKIAERRRTERSEVDENDLRI